MGEKGNPNVSGSYNPCATAREIGGCALKNTPSRQITAQDLFNCPAFSSRPYGDVPDCHETIHKLAERIQQQSKRTDPHTPSDIPPEFFQEA